MFIRNIRNISKNKKEERRQRKKKERKKEERRKKKEERISTYLLPSRVQSLPVLVVYPAAHDVELLNVVVPQHPVDDLVDRVGAQVVEPQ